MVETFWQNKIYNFRHNLWEFSPESGDVVKFKPFVSHEAICCDCVDRCGQYAVIVVYDTEAEQKWLDSGRYIVPELFLFPTYKS